MWREACVVHHHGPPAWPPMWLTVMVGGNPGKVLIQNMLLENRKAQAEFSFAVYFELANWFIHHKLLNELHVQLF